MPLLYIKRYTRGLIQYRKDWTFVFGDNLERWGRAGQAAEARGEPNAIGIPTKQSPDRYLTDDHYRIWLDATVMDFLALRHLAVNHRVIIWPLDNIGTGFAGSLEQKAPSIWATIEGLRKELEAAP